MSKTKTTETNATKTNKSVETLLTVTELKQFFVANGVIPKFTDNAHYVGCGTRSNVFSVNALKTKYNIYCNDDVFEMVQNIDGCEYFANGNSNDKTRNNLIVATTTETLKKMVECIKSGLSGVSIA